MAGGLGGQEAQIGSDAHPMQNAVLELACLFGTEEEEPNQRTNGGRNEHHRFLPPSHHISDDEALLRQPFHRGDGNASLVGGGNPTEIEG